MTREEARAAVAKGAALLDVQRPGWARSIDVGRLDISSCYACILGQLYGGYVRALDLAALESVEARCDSGFTTTCALDTAGTYALLQDAWIEVIADRLVSHEPAPVEHVGVAD